MFYEGNLIFLEIIDIGVDYNLIFDIICFFLKVCKWRLIIIFFIFGYKILVSNDGNKFSLFYLMYILDLIC